MGSLVRMGAVGRVRALVMLGGFALTVAVGLVHEGSAWALPPEQFGPEQFGIYSFQTDLFKDEAETEPATQAGSHPAAVTVNVQFNHELVEEKEYRYGKNEEKHSGEFIDEVRIYGDPRDVVANLPRGFVVDPAATPVKCNEAELLGTLSGHHCPTASAVGVLNAHVDGGGFLLDTLTFPVYNIVAPPDAPALLGVNLAGLGLVLHFSGRVRTGGDYGLTGEASGIGQLRMVFGAKLTLWGDPSAAGHDPWRGECGAHKHRQEEEEGHYPSLCPVEPFSTPLLTMPTSCPGAPLESSASADSWQEPNHFVLSAPFFSPAVTECSSLDFSPGIEVQPETSAADSPTGLHVDLHVPQSENLATLAEANLKDAVVTLPEGMVVNPSSADGLQGCSSAQVDLHGEGPTHCPDASKIGSVLVTTPLLERPLPGSVYIAGQGDNPFGSLLAIYVVVEGQGVIVKLAGHVEADPVTGRLRTTFEENPQLPFEDFKLHFFGGPRAPLTTPPTCGVDTTEAVLTPWSGTLPVRLAGEPNSFKVVTSPNGTGCPNALGEEPSHPGFVAGTLSSVAGSFSPFLLKLERENGSQIFKGLNVTLPPGLIGKLAGVPLCTQAQIEEAEHKPGGTEQSSPSCPAASQVGTVSVGAGSGSPFYASGRAYLAGPYKGAPFSLVIVTPALAGPFDLGTVVVRSALFIDPHTAQVTVKSDPFPTILQGIPLDDRSIAVSVDRPQFTLNPTSCEPMATVAKVIAQSSEAPLSSVFQATHCEKLSFKPSLTASTAGRTSKASGASFVVKVTQQSGEANIHKVSLTLPLALPARLTTLQKACTEAQFNINPAGCPEGSNIGTATARTPLLSSSLTGPAYLVSHGGAAFPDVEFVLQGEGVQVILDGNTDIKKGVTYSKFETVPDAPISSFETVLPQGPHSALAANANLCATKTVTVKKRVTIHRHGHAIHVQRKTKKQVPATVLTMPTTTITAQNGAQTTHNTRITITGCPKTTAPKTSGKKRKR